VNTAPLRIRSYAKVNLALAVLGKRDDGFHEIRTVLQSIDLFDEIELQPAAHLEVHCRQLRGVPNDRNTVWRAAYSLAKLASPPTQAEITLRKRIPIGAGLGGGSSNAAAVLLGLSRLWNLRLDAGTLRGLASEIGSDVPFFLQGGTAMGIGRGEEIYPLPDIHPAHIVVVYPGIHISTAEAYRSLSLMLTSEQATHKIQGLCERLAERNSLAAMIFNDFETSILPAYPAVREARDFLVERGATAAMLSGSGSSVFGFFPDEESALAASRPCSMRESWRLFPTKTLSRAEYFQGIFGQSSGHRNLVP
jgi:4-diphosphocytidyl-2-C-methyl-D-erythritol kinase